MRMEELSQNRYIKTPDTVEKYLLELVQAYFSEGDKIPEISREHIIQKAVDRMKEELRLDSMGVTSIIINDEERIGAVTVTLEDLNGEPKIDPKHDAFNVDFGAEKGTACEGNDPRLFDKRTPLPHKHTVSDIIGLEGIISSLNGKVQRIDGLVHEHKNKDILDRLVYTGNNNVIDLTLLDSLKNNIYDLVSEIRQETVDYKNDINNKVIDIESSISNVSSAIDTLKQYIIDTNEDYYKQAKEYTDTKYDSLKSEINTSISGFAEKDELTDILTLAKQSIGLLGTFSFRVSQTMDLSINSNQFTGSINIPDDIMSSMDALGLSIDEYVIEFLLCFKNVSGLYVYAPIPYIVFNNSSMKGSLEIEYNSSAVTVTYSCTDKLIPNEIQSGTIICNIYSKQGALS